MRKRKDNLLLLIWLIPFILLILAFEILPVITIINSSFLQSDGTYYTLKQYKLIFNNKFYLQSIENSVVISLISSIVGLLVALIGSHSITKLPAKVRDNVLMLSNMTSNFAGVPLAFAFMILIGINGVFTVIAKNLGIKLFQGFNLYSEMGLIVVYIYFQIPLGILLLYPVFDNIKKEWIDAAVMLGASSINFWRYIGLPVILPGLLGTFGILFANAMGAYATAYALVGNFNLMTIRISSLISGDITLDPNLASGMAVILGLILISFTLLNEMMLKKGNNVR